MKLSTILCKCTCILVILILLSASSFVSATPASSQTAQKQKDDEPESTSPKKRKARETWEIIVSLPGQILFFPLRLVFMATEEAVTFLFDKQVIPRINDYLNSDDGLRTGYPVYYARTGGGMHYIQRSLFSKESELEVEATLGLRWRRRFHGKIQNIRLGGTFYSELSATYQLLNDEPFYGLGNDSVKSEKSNFTHRQLSTEIAFGFSLGQSTSIYTQIGYERNDIHDGRNRNLPSTPDLYTEEILPGLTRRIKFGKLRLALHYDGKNHPGHPTSGSEVFIHSSVFNDFKTNEFAFWKTALDLTHYLNVFYDRVLVFRVSGEITRPFSGRNIPFYYLSEIGEVGTVRGFDRGRFRDRDKILGSIEYRYPIWLLMDAVFFIDAGMVSDDIFDNFSIKRLYMGYGGGIRLWGKQGMVAKFEIGNSKDGLRVYFILGKGF